MLIDWSSFVTVSLVLWDKCAAELGTPDLVINNAGIANEKNWQKTVGINLVS